MRRVVKRARCMKALLMQKESAFPADVCVFGTRELATGTICFGFELVLVESKAMRVAEMLVLHDQINSTFLI